MKTWFADTFYFLVILNPTDAAHHRALDVTRGLRVRIFTTTWVLTEVADAMAPKNRQRFSALLRLLQSNPASQLIPASQGLFDRGVELYENRPDKGWSLTDCISFVVMQDRGITDALTGDHHFEQAGFRAMLK